MFYQQTVFCFTLEEEQFNNSVLKKGMYLQKKKKLLYIEKEHFDDSVSKEG